MVNTIKFSEFDNADLSDNLSNLVGSTSTGGGKNIKFEFPLAWSTSGRPSSPTLGLMGFNTDLSNYEFWNGSTWVQFASGGSGTVNTGLINQLAYYNANGDAVSGLSTSASGILKTDSGGDPSISTTMPAGITVPQPVIQGFVNGTSAASGIVGQVLSSFITFANSVSVSNNVMTDITSLLVPAGQFLLMGNIFASDPGGQMTSTTGWINTVSMIPPDNSLVSGFNAGSTHLDMQSYYFSVPMTTINITTPTTYYLSVNISSLSGLSKLACGNLIALRVR